MVNRERVFQKKAGTRKLYVMINKELKTKGISIGRDALHKLLSREGLLVVQRKRRRPAGTDGNGLAVAPDYRTGNPPTRILQLWCMDITYITMWDGSFCYATFILDEYSHLIVGFCVSERMLAVQVIEAVGLAGRGHLAGATEENPGPFLHSDRGGQFKSHVYINLLGQYHMTRSMTQNGDPQENPVSERLNGIMKDEFLGDMGYKTIEAARLAVAGAVATYNTRRPHSSISMLTPSEAHCGGHKDLKRLWDTPGKKR